jgi:hypothetical protein
MAKKRGGQRKHWAELARVGAWYNEVQRRCGWTDYRLNYKFAWREGQRPDKSNDQRPRTFEWLRKNGRQPAGRDQRWRSMEELVEAVERYPGFSGTQALYEAKLWDLMQEDVLQPDQVLSRLDNLLSAHSLVHLPLDRAIHREHPLPAEFDEASIYDRCLALALRQMDQYNSIALVWLLYLLTEPAHNWRFRAILESRADEMLDNFFAVHLGDNHLMYYSHAVRTLLAARLDLSEQRTGGYGYIETSGRWLVVPKDLAGRVTVEHLMSAFEIITLFGTTRPAADG